MAKSRVARPVCQLPDALPPPVHVLAQMAAGKPIDFDALRAWHDQTDPWLQRLAPDLAAKMFGLPDPSTWVIPCISIGNRADA